MTTVVLEQIRTDLTVVLGDMYVALDFASIHGGRPDEIHDPLVLGNLPKIQEKLIRSGVADELGGVIPQIVIDYVLAIEASPHSGSRAPKDGNNDPGHQNSYVKFIEDGLRRFGVVF